MRIHATDLAETPAATFEHVPLPSARTKFDGYDDGPPTLITVNGKTSFRHMVSNGGDVLAVLRTHKHVLAIGAHSHVGERVTLFNEGVRTRFEQSPAVVGPAGAGPLVFPAAVVRYSVSGGRIGDGVFVEVNLDEKIELDHGVGRGRAPPRDRCSYRRTTAPSVA